MTERREPYRLYSEVMAGLAPYQVAMCDDILHDIQVVLDLGAMTIPEIVEVLERLKQVLSERGLR